MALTLAPNFTQRNYTWTEWKAVRVTKNLVGQYDEDAFTYLIYGYDGPEVHVCTIWKGTVPSNITSVYSQAQNDSDKSEFTSDYQAYFNGQIDRDSRSLSLVHRLGNLTAASTSEVLVCTRGYTELNSQRQCSVKSSSNTDKDSNATGAREVRITFLNSNYELKTEDVLVNGTTKVNTVATDIRFIQSFEIIKGTAAVGAISLLDGTAGNASEFCGISAGTYDAFLCHHYVPAGMRAWVIGWGATVDDDANFKLMGRKMFGSNLVDRHLDLENLPVAIRSEFYRAFPSALLVDETGYIRVTTVPGQSTSTVIRATLDIWEDKS